MRLPYFLTHLRENKELLTVEESELLHELLGFYKFIANQREVLKEHESKFVSEFSGKGNPYVEFRKFRQIIGDMSGKDLDKLIVTWCLHNRKSINMVKKISSLNFSN